MLGYFLDTSALVKHYHPEVGSGEVDRLWNEPAPSLIVSRLSVLEIVSAFAGKVRTGTILAGDFATLRRRFFADVSNKRFATMRLLVLHFKEGERLLRDYGLSVRLRTLDALQLAVALDPKARGVVSHFVCADRGLLTIAVRESFQVVNPENPSP